MPSTDKQFDQTCVLAVGKLLRSFGDSLLKSGSKKAFSSSGLKAKFWK